MKTKRPQTEEARERVLRAAEQVVMERGNSAVTLRDVAASLGMCQASLDDHAPGGQYELFGTVTERVLTRHQDGIETARQAGHDDLRAQLRSVAHRYLSQPWMPDVRLRLPPTVSPRQAKELP